MYAYYTGLIVLKYLPVSSQEKSGDILMFLRIILATYIRVFWSFQPQLKKWKWFE